MESFLYHIKLRDIEEILLEKEEVRFLVKLVFLQRFFHQITPLCENSSWNIARTLFKDLKRPDVSAITNDTLLM